MVIWKSESSSSRNASNSSSARSSSSMRRTGAGVARADDRSPRAAAGAAGTRARRRRARWPAARLAARFEQADLEDLPRVVPLVDRALEIEALVALEPDQRAIEHRGQHLGDLGLADAGLALEEERLAETQREEHRGGETAIRHVVRGPQPLRDFVDRRRQRCRAPLGRAGAVAQDARSLASLSARRPKTFARWTRYSPEANTSPSGSSAVRLPLTAASIAASSSALPASAPPTPARRAESR